MSKKFGKFVLAATAVTTAVAAVYYFNKKKQETYVDIPEDDDLDVFRDDTPDEDRTYVELTREESSAGAAEDGDGSKSAAVKEAATAVIDNLTTISSKVAKKAGTVINRTIEAVEGFLDDVSEDEGLGGIIHDASETVQDMAQAVGEKAADVVEGVAEKAEDAAKKVEDAVEDAAKKAEDFAEDVTEKAEDAVKKAADATEDAVKKAEETTTPEEGSDKQESGVPESVISEEVLFDEDDTEE